MTGNDISQLVPTKELIQAYANAVGGRYYIMTIHAGQDLLGGNNQPLYEHEKPYVYEPAWQAFQLLWSSSPGSWQEQLAIQKLDNAARIMARDYLLKGLYRALDKIQHDQLIQEWWYHIDPNLIEWQCYPYTRTYQFPPYIETITLKKPVEGQEWKFYRDTDLAQAVEAYFQTELQPEKDSFLKRINELKQVMQALATEPIMIGSGQWIKKTRNVQQSSTDRNAQITNQFSNQPTMQAVIRIPSLGYIVCQTCGSRERSDSTHCTACGKAIDPIVVLKVERSTQGISMNERNQRITTIKQYNLAQKYLRKRADVEAEITARQQMPQPPPQQPKPPKPKPATPAASPLSPPSPVQPPAAAPGAPAQPVPTPRKRVVPAPVAVQGKQCKQCGTQNNQTANFCQHCGAKL